MRSPLLPTLIDDLDELGPYLVALRLERGYTLTRLSELSGLNPTMISSWEKGHVKPSSTNLFRVIKALRGTFAIVPDEARKDRS